ncbi:SpoIIE family protein phosphatase [Streptomyces sp. NPDC051636]|uniref:SpoIIE family protein phosphatase n=1 Tax=Streptomyces sp. NPDC051636 TaxID=3365663 RepID=UPI003788379C
MEQLPTPHGRQAPAHAVPEGAYTATATVNEQGIVTGWSDGARRLLGYPASEVVGHRAARLLAGGTGDGGEAGARAWRDAAACRMWSGTVALRHRDGHRLERNLLAHHRGTADPGAGWLVMSAVTGAARTRGGAALAEWAFDQSPCVLAVFDEDLRLVRATAGMERVLSLGEETMRGLRLPEIVPHPLSDRAETAMRLALDHGEPQSVRVCLQPAGATGAGAERGWQGSLTPVEDPAGRVRGVCLVVDLPEHLMRQRMRLLNDAMVRVGTGTGIQRTAQELTEVAVPGFADVAVVDLLHGPGVGERPAAAKAGPLATGRAAVRSVPVPGEGPVSLRAGEASRYPVWSPAGQCLAQGHGAVYAGTDAALARWVEGDPQASWIRETGTHSLMVVPVRAAGTTLGVALFARHRRPDPFDADDLWLAEQLAAKAATSIHGDRHAPREHTTTMTLQRSLLPRTLPEQGAVDIATRYLPAAGRAGVGGDWFDVIPLSGTRVALVVGDVVGHGIRASATMGRVRTAVRTLADVDLPPDELLTHLDDLVLHLAADETGPDPDGATAETAGGVGTTCLYAVYDPVTRRLSAARAGHPPPAVVTPTGAVRFLDAPPGPPLGLGGLPFEAFETELPEGSLLALYTNGLLDVRHHDIDDALDKMFAALARPASSLDTVCDRVLAAMLTHRPDDDIALLIARTHALHADRVATWHLPSDPAIVAHARQQATDQLTTWHLGEAAFITELVVSELVTNAIRYGQPPIRLRLIHTHHTLTCEVTDSGNTTPHMRRAHTYDEGGRGLLLIGRLTHRWGTRHHATGKTVWTEQFLTDG